MVRVELSTNAAGDSIQARRNFRGGKCAVGRAVTRMSIGAMKLFKGIECKSMNKVLKEWELRCIVYNLHEKNYISIQ